MPKIQREKTRTEHIAEALDHLQHAMAALKHINLRKVPNGALKDSVRSAREVTELAARHVHTALREDVQLDKGPPPRVTERRSEEPDPPS